MLQIDLNIYVDPLLCILGCNNHTLTQYPVGNGVEDFSSNDCHLMQPQVFGWAEGHVTISEGNSPIGM